MKRTLLLALRLLATGAVLIAAQRAVAAEKPNVILVMTDDQGYGDLSCHGNPVLKTPNLDRLHAQSIRFTDYHVAPMCTPTRGELMTGMQAFRNGAVYVCQGKSMIRRGIPTIRKGHPRHSGLGDINHQFARPRRIAGRVTAGLEAKQQLQSSVRGSLGGA